MVTRIIGLIFLFITSWAHAAQEGIAIPDELKNWVPWVLEGKEGANCPFEYQSSKNHHCAWPEKLSLDVHAGGGLFSQNWTVYEESWIALPGNKKHWPQSVTVNEKPVVVSDKKGRPYVHLKKGSYQVAGDFIWSELPEFIDLPKTTGLINISIDKKQIEFPHFEANGRLWLNESTSQASVADEDRLQIDVFRRVIDDVPLKVVTRLDLNVVGQAREIVLGPLFSDEYVPLSVTGPLPMRLEVDGKLRMQARPGRWTIQIEARHKKAVDLLSLSASDLPDSEIWVFDARPSLRLVEIDGVSSVDPRQTRLPGEWQNLPAYRVSKTDAFKIITKRRGDPNPAANELMMQRHLWLDFDGGGYTFQDQIRGQMRQEWRLSMTPEMMLGRVVVNGVDQLVTRLEGREEQGIEVRQGEISIQADGRYQGDISEVPAIGWLDNFTQVQATLHLPPGWRLFAASGADSVGGSSWLDRWSLLDIFLVLITALAVYHLFGKMWGAIALACFVISWHESGAPQYIWLLVIVALALMRVAPEGKLRKSMGVVRYLSLLGLLFIAIPYMIDTVRTAIYPQLEQPTVISSYSASIAVEQDEALLVESKAISMESAVTESFYAEKSSMDKVYQPSPISIHSERIDPHAKVQTGPGLPSWKWSSVPIQWSGPVHEGQMLGLTLIPPALTTLIKLVCVILVLLLGLRLAGISLKARRITMEFAKLGVMGLFIGNALLFVPSDALADIPSSKLLNELQSRLLTPAECLPQCAQISRMKLDVQPDLIRILLEVHASEDVAVPMPGEINGWLAERVTLNGQQSQAIRGANNALWVYVPKGKHRIQIAGSIKSVRVLQLPLPLQPKLIDVDAKGWIVKGVHKDGSIEKALQLERKIAEGEKAKVLEQTVLPPFVMVTRTLRLGLEWQVETEVKRISPEGSAIALEIPLISNESVTTDGIRVTDGKAVIQFAPQQRTVRWSSVLEPSESILLRAAETLNWVEQWRLDVSPIWHATLSGIPQIHHQSHQGTWFPKWHPWPGEELTISVSKPIGVEGKTITIDDTQLTVKPGQRATDVVLNMRLRSSHAGQHIVKLPENVALGVVEINGRSQPIRQEEGGVVRLPIAPGEQQIILNWQEANGVSSLLSTPQVDLGIESVNANIDIQVPKGRWTLLTFGPQLGPAVLFWGVLIVIIVIAIGLGRTHKTPLKTYQWLLLGIGLSQTSVGIAVLIVGWLFAMGYRQNSLTHTVKPQTFNMIQVGLGMLTVIALLGLIGAVGTGLLGHPDMQVSGNGSSAYYLKWYADHSNELLPTATVVSAPMWLYRVLMLAWSLWLAFALLGWLKWSWQCFTTNGLWKHVPIKSKSKTKGKKLNKDEKPKSDEELLLDFKDDK